MKLISTAHESLADFVDFLTVASHEGRAGRANTSEPALLVTALCTAYPALIPRTKWQVQTVNELLESGPVTRVEPQELSLRFKATWVDDRPTFLRNLRRALFRERVRIALLELLPPELGGVTVEVSSAQWSDIADAALEVTTAWSVAKAESWFGTPRRDDGKRSTFCVIALGKLGARELNPGSDVDICFFFDSIGGQSSLPLSEHWTRTAQLIISCLDECTEDGVAYRIDARLRPFGRKGPLCTSLAAAEDYFESWGRLWERAAWIRSRHVAGDQKLAERIAGEIVLPFVFRKEVEQTLLPKVQSLLPRSRHRYDAEWIELKLGKGAIREAELFVHGLQLLWGGSVPSLQVGNTWTALQRLAAVGLVSAHVADGVAQAYGLLRTIEHRVQLAAGIQTHRLSRDPTALERVSRTLTWKGPWDLLRRIGDAQALISGAFDSLAPGSASVPLRYHALFEWLEDRHGLDEAPVDAGIRPEAAAMSRVPDAVSEELRSYGLLEGSPEFSAHVLALAAHRDLLLGDRNRQLHPVFCERVLDGLLGSADPEQAARYLRTILANVSHHQGYVRRLMDKSESLATWTTVLGSSAFVGDCLVSQPDLLDCFFRGEAEVSSAPAWVRKEVEEVIRENSADTMPLEAYVAKLRKIKTRTIFATAVADLTCTIDRKEAQLRMTALADAMVDASLTRAMDGAPISIGVVALGTLGSGEMGYGSDLDLLFVYDAETEAVDMNPLSLCVQIAQATIAVLTLAHPEGPGYAVDSRLRPFGSQGTLVTSLQSFASYHGWALHARIDGGAVGPSRRSSSPWERQSLLRARWCAGDPRLGIRFIQLAARFAYEGGAPSGEAIFSVRERMRKELGRESKHRRDFKYGKGGLQDVEFAVQYLQMRHGMDPCVRALGVGPALNGLLAGHYISDTDSACLRGGYDFLQELAQKLHVLHGTATTRIDSRADGLGKLARRLGIYDDSRLSAAEILMARYEETTRRIRRTFERIVLGASGN